MNSRVLVLSALLLSGSWSAAAQSVYKWKDAGGIIHYSSEKPFAEAQPVELPPIMRADVPIPEVVVTSCDQHGGINCAAGPDVDGSVVCHDGFRDAAALYRFNCYTARLNIDKIDELDEAGYFTVYVRNRESVKAEGVALYLTVVSPSIRLQGATEVEGYGIAEYRLQQDYGQGPWEKPRLEQLQLECTNCPE